MPLMYIAKINLNSKIFDVYEERLRLGEVLNEIFEKMNEKDNYKIRKRKEFKDSLGNTKVYIKTSEYQFNELTKFEEEKIVTGKVIRTYNRPTEDFNEKNELVDVYVQEHVSIYFYFDVRKELVTFSVRQAFGYNQFIEAFKYLLNISIKDYEFEVFLKKDQNMLERKLKSLRKVKRVSATLIPPNSNEGELKALRESIGYIAECRDTNAKKIKLDLIDTDDIGLNMEAKMMRETISAAVKGYGDITTYGINKNGREQIVKSNTDAALTRVVNENLTEDDYNVEARDFIAAVRAESMLNI
ncbi:hypothetical protein [Clostridium magnum]|uniref:DUF4747 domain-containing protein n=1 Tax=Clostridium magnum DSM 2767 TaxID=1121326 RepID=A0A161YGA8_9CLOT|nr:hypothetical protein [Clostridium magnum]KZL89172.1 hypothetical protein CLMAG_53900 [Clostridium magnum DSM 2767]SHJ24823.1 hypothetical protein SAMN02745944_05604 [Clostridium magnum DSM 2767]